MSIPPDVQEFLDEYPDVVDDPTSRANFEFYSNNMPCSPDNRTIEEIHERCWFAFCFRHVFASNDLLISFVPPCRWFGEYDKLEYKHGYIQWL
jgi:hypothetical protein